jgi:tetratricopeptide (TPR) repeat protein
MRSLRPSLFSICFVPVLVVSLTTSSLFAQGKKSTNELQELRKENEALRKEVQGVRRLLEELNGQLEGVQAVGTSAATEAESPPSSRAAASSLAAREERRLELRKKVLESALLSHGDAGLVALLRFEKANACREAGMLDKAVGELRKIIVQNLGEEVTNAARWTLVEVFQEQKQKEEAIAELQKILAASKLPEKKKEAIYGTINLSGDDPGSRIQRIDSLIERLIADSVSSRAKGEEVPAPSKGRQFAIPEENLQIFGEMKGCTANLSRIYAATKKYEKDKGKLPDWLSDLVPDYLSKEALLCPDDPDYTTIWYPDPKLPCSYSYEFSPARAGIEYTGGRDISCREWKTQQLKFFGDVVPVVRCVHHSPELNVSCGGQVYMSGMRWEADLMPNYYRGVEFNDLPPETPEDVREQTQKQLEKVLEVCKKYSARKDKELSELQSEAIAEISSFGSTTDEQGQLRTQITVGNDEHILYHIVDGHIGGETVGFMRAFVDEKPLDKKPGAFLRLVPGRSTLWRYDYFPEWGWYIMVEGHWYDE